MRQEDRILNLFRMANKDLTPTDFEIYFKSTGEDYPLPSIRRAITNLTDLGYLVKMPKMKSTTRGMGGEEHHWRLASGKEKDDQTKLF